MDDNKHLQDFSIKNGIIISLVNIVLILILYIMGLSYFGGFSRLIPYLTTIILVLVIGFRLRKLNGGFIEFKQALKYIFLIFIIIEVSFTMFDILMNKVIDPNLAQKMKQVAIQKSVGWMEKFNAPQDRIDEAVKQMEAKDFSFKFSTVFLSLGIWIIVDFFIALIFSAIIKRPKIFDGEIVSDKIST